MKVTMEALQITSLLVRQIDDKRTGKTFCILQPSYCISTEILALAALTLTSQSGLVPTQLDIEAAVLQGTLNKPTSDFLSSADPRHQNALHLLTGVAPDSRKCQGSHQIASGHS